MTEPTQRLTDTRYIDTVTEVSPNRTVVPQQRKRLYFIGIDNKVSNDSTMERITNLCAIVESKPTLLDINKFLLPDDHHLVKRELERLLERKAAPTTGSKRKRQQGLDTMGGLLGPNAGPKSPELKRPKWLDKQLELASKSCASVLAPPKWGASVWESEKAQDTCPWFRTLTTREQHCLMTLQSSLPKRPCDAKTAGTTDKETSENPDQHHILDLSQGAERRTMNRQIDCINCITPEGVCWHAERMRPLLGTEKLALQCIFPKAESIERFDNRLLGNLAGNAFNGQDWLKVFLCTCSALAESLPALSEMQSVEKQ